MLTSVRESLDIFSFRKPFVESEALPQMWAQPSRSSPVQTKPLSGWSPRGRLFDGWQFGHLIFLVVITAELCSLKSMPHRMPCPSGRTLGNFCSKMDCWLGYDREHSILQHHPSAAFSVTTADRGELVLGLFKSIFKTTFYYTLKTP